MGLCELGKLFAHKKLQEPAASQDSGADLEELGNLILLCEDTGSLRYALAISSPSLFS